MVKLLLCKSDTVYRYGWELNAIPCKPPRISYIWYHKNNHIHLYLLQDGRFTRYRKIPAINYAVEDTIAEYFHDGFLGEEPKYGECFRDKLDDTYFDVYIKNEGELFISLDYYCLKNEECEKGTFKYKLKYDLQKVTESLKPYINRKKIDNYLNTPY
ncbi:MAG: hypothetical protein R3Y59_09335 [bacterium]